MANKNPKISTYSPSKLRSEWYPRTPFTGRQLEVTAKARAVQQATPLRKIAPAHTLGDARRLVNQLESAAETSRVLSKSEHTDPKRKREFARHAKVLDVQAKKVKSVIKKVEKKKKKKTMTKSYSKPGDQPRVPAGSSDGGQWTR